jgi:hypothetical protein
LCGPAALPILAIAATAVTAGGQLYAGAAAKQQGKYEKQIADQNAAAERTAAADAAKRGETAQLQRYRQLAQSLGAQRAASAANGVDIDFGSALGTQLDTAQIGYEDSSTLAENTRREQMGFDINAANYTMQGRAALAKGKAAQVSSYFQAAGTVLGGAQQVKGMGK